MCGWRWMRCRMPRDRKPAPASIREIRVGLPENFYFDLVAPEVKAAVHGCGAASRTIGRARDPGPRSRYRSAQHSRPGDSALEAAAVHQAHLHRRGDFGTDVLALLDSRLADSGGRLRECAAAAQAAAGEFHKLFRSIDCLFTPTTPITAPRIGQTEITLDGAGMTRGCSPRGLRAASTCSDSPPCRFLAAHRPTGCRSACNSSRGRSRRISCSRWAKPWSSCKTRLLNWHLAASIKSVVLPPDPPLSKIAADSADTPPLRDALQWFVRQKQWINEQHLQLCRIAASTFFEQRRAEWMLAQFRALGCIARIDRGGNVIAHPVENRTGPYVALTAHLDTVLAPRKDEEVYVAPDGRLHGPGVADNGAGLAALLAIARAIPSFPESHRRVSKSRFYR